MFGSGNGFGVRSGRNMDKFDLPKGMKLTKEAAGKVSAPIIAESPVCLECKVKEILELGSHDMFVGEVVATNIDEKYLDEKGVFRLDKANLITYSHGQYFALGRKLGKFGYSVRKKHKKKKK